MPKVKAERTPSAKSTPYPSSKPLSAGPIPIVPFEVLTAQAKKAEKKAAKAERKKARRESSGGVPILPQLSSASQTQESQGPARTESGASNALSGATSSGVTTVEKKKKKDRKKKNKDVSDGKVDDLTMEINVEEGPSVQPYPQPGTIESTEDIVARLKAKGGKKHKSRLSQGSQGEEGHTSKKQKKKFTMLNDGKILLLQKELDDAKTAAETERAGWKAEKVEMEKKVKEAEGKIEVQIETSKVAMEEKEKDLAKNIKVLDTLREAATCGVCLDYLKDPHILACGHIACKSCLVSWFRTPVAFLHDVPDLLEGGVSVNRDVSYRTKLCHVCRIPILRRPSRMYHFDSILEPLGINPQLPTLSQDAKEKDDSWKNLFPPERNTYRVVDEEDHIDRCPECHGEIDDDYCQSCDIEFSESGGDELVLSEEEEEMDEMDGAEVEDGEEVGLSAAERRAELAAEVRAEREIQAQENILASRANMFDMEARDSDSEEEDEEDDEDRPVMRGSNGGIFGEDDDEEDEDDSDDEVVQMHRREFRARDLDSEAEPTDEDEYEDSFIDDGEDEEEGGSMNETGDDIIVVEPKEDDAEEDVSMDQMRERRLARFGSGKARDQDVPARSISPVVRSSGIMPRRRIIASSGSESD